MSGFKRSAREVFDDWARDHHADGMEQHHWPHVRRVLERMPPSEGAYLEIGVGNGYGIRHMATGAFTGGSCVGLDLSGHMAQRAREKTADLNNVRIEHADFLSWDPGPPRFDVIFSMEVFYYFPRIEEGLARAHQLLRPGGVLWVLVNYYTEHEASHEWPGQLDTPMTLWSGEEYRRGFEQAGFVDVEQSRIRESADAQDPGTLATRGVRGD